MSLSVCVNVNTISPIIILWQVRQELFNTFVLPVTKRKNLQITEKKQQIALTIIDMAKTGHPRLVLITPT